MNRLYNAIISKDTDARLKEHGLTLAVDWDDDTPSPRASLKSILVFDATYNLVSYHGDYNIDIDNFEKSVVDFFTNTIKVSMDNVEWSPLYMNNEDAICYSLEPFHDVLNDGLMGFVYNEKESNCTKTKEEYRFDFTRSALMYSEWQNNHVYRIRLTANADDKRKTAIDMFRGDLYSVEPSDADWYRNVDRTANLLIDTAIENN